MKKILYLCLVSMFFLTSHLALSQNAKEAIQNTNQLSQGKKDLERDKKELGVLKLKLVSFHNAFQVNNVVKTNELKVSILADFKREIAQNRIKVTRAKKEIAQSKSEVRSSRREVKRDRKDRRDPNPYDKRDDRRDLKRDQVNKIDDHRDLKDDKVDHQKLLLRVNRQQAIYDALTNYSFFADGHDPAVSTKKKLLVKEFIDTMEADIQATKLELLEDNKERKEDKRERRDDRRERREIR